MEKNILRITGEREGEKTVLRDEDSLWGADEKGPIVMWDTESASCPITFLENDAGTSVDSKPQ